MGKAFNADIPLKQRNVCGSFFREESEKARLLTAKIKQAKREIDAIIDKLFDLTLARSRFSKVRLPGNIDCHVNGWRLSFAQVSGTLSMGARPSKPPRVDARLNPRTRSGADHDAPFYRGTEEAPETDFKIKTLSRFFAWPKSRLRISPRREHV
jgi:hypothetical protein